MLGKGLESLIPPQKKNPVSDDTPRPVLSDSPAPVVPPDPVPAPQPVQIPQSQPQPIEPPKVVPAPEPLPGGAVNQYAQSNPEPVFSKEPFPTAPVSPRPVVFSDTSYEPRPSSHQAVFLVEVEKIKPNPHQPRRHFDEAAIRDLGNSIREHGIIQPLTVTKIETEVPTGTAVEYQLIAGERRLMAAKLIGLPRVPVIIHKLERGANQSLELAIIENLQRENLNPIEMARAFARLQDEFRMTQREIAVRLGKSRETVANTLRLLDLPFVIQEAIGHGEISESHGRLLLAIKDPSAQEQLFRDLLNKSLTTRELKAQVALTEGKDNRGRRPSTSTPELSMLQEQLSRVLHAPVNISQMGESGKITINYYSKEELQNIINSLGDKLNEEEGGF